MKYEKDAQGLVHRETE